MPSCAFTRCKNSSRTKNKVHGITFHTFPQDEVWRLKWLFVVRKQRQEPKWIPSNNSRVCSIHFKSEDMYTTNKGYKKLRKCAVPHFRIICDDEDDEELFGKTIGESDLSEEETDDTNESDTTDPTEIPKSEKHLKTKRISAKNIDTGANKKPRLDIDDIKINYHNIDKFGEQIAFLLKRIPRQLCTELQHSIVTLVKTATIDYLKKVETVVPSTSSNTKAVDVVSQNVLTPFVTKPNEITVKIEPEDTNVITEVQLEKQPFTSAIKTLPMTVPIELVGSLDCVKQEPLDPGETNDDTAQEYNEDTLSEDVSVDPKILVKVEMEECDSNGELNRGADSSND